MNNKWFYSVAVIILTGCIDTGTTLVDIDQRKKTWSWRLPPNFPTPLIPNDNPMTNEKFLLGRHLFYDKRLSGNQKMACSSCHHQDKAFTDGKIVSIGSTGDALFRNAPSLLNSAYHSTYTWVNPKITTLEDQMRIPLFAEDIVEMGINNMNQDEILARFQRDDHYQKLFNQAFPDEVTPIHFDNIINAISTFQRGLLTGQSKLERYQRREITLTAAENRGRLLFNGEKAECFHCHGSFNFNDQVSYTGMRQTLHSFHNTGLYNIGGIGDFPEKNQGLYDFTSKETDKGLFRVPSLWNVGLTAPYMHDGSIATLNEVLDFYAAGGRNITLGEYAGDGRKNPNKSDLIVEIDLTEDEKADLIAFLHTLTDETIATNENYANPFN